MSTTNRAETYYYGQGRVFLAPRNSDNTIGAWRWVGDVGAMSISMSTEAASHKESYSGQKAKVREFNISNEASITSTWYERSAENLAVLLYGESTITDAGTVTGEALPAGIKAGERYTLVHQNVSNVVIGSLVEGTDYTLDALYGAIEFITEPATQPVTVNYEHKGSSSTAMFASTPKDMALRFEGINLAENGAPVVIELYKVKFQPAQALDLINNDTSLSGMETTAGILMDSSRVSDTSLGRFGRIININTD